VLIAELGLAFWIAQPGAVLAEMKLGWVAERVLVAVVSGNTRIPVGQNIYDELGGTISRLSRSLEHDFNYTNKLIQNNTEVDYNGLSPADEGITPWTMA
jgi:hypothetical protein